MKNLLERLDKKEKVMKKIFFIFCFLKIIVFSQQNDMIFLFSDTKALQKGDIVKIVILEKTIANEKVSTTTGKKYNTEGEISKFPYINNNLPTWSWDHKEGYTGTGELKRENYITGVIMGKVVDITQEGLYKIEGEKEVDINGSKQIIKVSGYVRGQDISEENTIYSSLISDLKLKIIGKGYIEEKRSPGILTRIFSFLRIF